MPWLIVRLKHRSFALPTQEVRELVMKPEVTCVPDSPPFVRGVMNIRGRMLPLVDLRLRVGMKAASEEAASFCALMEQRRQDHVNWLNELEASVREQRDFKLATDPHRCAFGRWYDSYTAENIWIGALLRRFADPHRQIHAVASNVIALSSKGDSASANVLIEQTRRGVLSKMIRLFASLQELIQESSQEIAVVLETGSRSFAVSVDEAAEVTKFDPEKLGELPLISSNGVASQFGIRGKDEPLVLMLSTAQLLPPHQV
jgi:purine-binding chemotaxis protein CheW